MNRSHQSHRELFIAGVLSQVAYTFDSQRMFQSSILCVWWHTLIRDKRGEWDGQRFSARLSRGGTMDPHAPGMARSDGKTRISGKPIIKHPPLK